MSRTAPRPAESPDAGAGPAPGRTTVVPRALDRVVSAVTADTFGVTARAVHVELSDRAGLLAVRVRTPIRVISLEQVTQMPTFVSATGGTLLRHAADGQSAIRERVTALTGAEIAHVTVELTGVEIRDRRRAA
ncbi:hypothetical protein ACFOYW_04840 [Gryllotalpicola reticulitermitis]|uniref:Asp23/Gls24 family envelope stress response protein n=1 Tax=Gryllotalpicola reticulitermitis TaxID=1184153 RepID=A0ABV8Q2N3_9MICO